MLNRLMKRAMPLCFLVFFSVCTAQPVAFKPGPLIKSYGMIADVPGHAVIPDEASFRISFDIASPGPAGELNRSIVSAARFINMHAAAGVSPDRIKLALVIHGKAVHDVTTGGHYGEMHAEENANAGLVAELLKHGVTIQVCGQSAAYHGVERGTLLPGVEMALSAMTAHALLQQDGYTLNPF